MKQLRYLIFLLFNLAYKDGNYDESQDPYFSSAVIIVAFQYFLILTVFFSMDKLIPLREHFESVLTAKWSRVLFFILLLGPINYYFFVKKKYFDRVYNEFKEATINTKINRSIGYCCLLLYWVLVFGVMASL